MEDYIFDTREEAEKNGFMSVRNGKRFKFSGESFIIMDVTEGSSFGYDFEVYRFVEGNATPTGVKSVTVTLRKERSISDHIGCYTQMFCPKNIENLFNKKMFKDVCEFYGVPVSDYDVPPNSICKFWCDDEGWHILNNMADLWDERWAPEDDSQAFRMGLVK